ncbi:hypothetical protein KKC59_02005 [bacterium]|nr:hypothetical protein [bacterium]
MNKSLVIYYSRTGNTKYAAEIIQKKCNADIEEIVENKNRKGVFGFIIAGMDAVLKRKSVVSSLSKNIDDYSDIYIGCPVWANGMPPAMKSFLEKTVIKNKNVYLFVTTHVSGGEQTIEQMKSLLGGNVFKKDVVIKTVLTQRKDFEETMRRILLFSIMISAIFFSSNCFSTPLEGPTMPDKNKWRIGYQTNVVVEQDIHYLQGDVNSFCNFINFSYGLNKYVCLDGKLGVGDVDYDRDIGEEFNYHTGFAGGYGFRVKLFDDETVDDNIKFIVGAHHICVHPHSISDSAGLKQEVVWDDWQVDGIMFKQFGSFIPYVGAKIKKVYLIRKTNGDRTRMKSDTEVGGACGFDYRFNDNWVFNAEARFIDEEAYSAGVSYLF